MPNHLKNINIDCIIYIKCNVLICTWPSWYTKTRAFSITRLKDRISKWIRVDSINVHMNICKWIRLLCVCKNCWCNNWLSEWCRFLYLFVQQTWKKLIWVQSNLSQPVCRTKEYPRSVFSIFNSHIYYLRVYTIQGNSVQLWPWRLHYNVDYIWLMSAENVQQNPHSSRATHSRHRQII